MADLAPVPGQRSPFDGWRGWVVGVVVIGILVAVAKPWGSDADTTALASPSAPIASTRVAGDPTPRPTAVGRIFDPFLLGPTAPKAAWAILTPRGLTALDFLTADPVATPSARPASAPAGPGPDVVAGPVVELGTTDDAGALAIAHPREVSLGTIRLWRFTPEGSPTRVDLDALTAAWAAPHVAVLGHRRTDMEPDVILGWDPGLYRLDLLIEPADAVRSVMLVVREGRDGSSAGVSEPAAGDEPPRGSSAFERGALRLLPRTANLWAVGGYLSGWYRHDSKPGCAVAEIWQATDPRDGCWPVPLGPTDAVGVNLIDDDVTSIGLRIVDPLPGPAGSASQLDVDGQSGLALVRAPAGGLADGIYRLDVGTADGRGLTWYLEVGPIGRAVAQFYERSASR
jgi:hypothetical protein